MEYLLIGKLIKPVGVKGQIKAQFYLDDINEIDNYTKFYIKLKKSPFGYREIDFMIARNTGTEAIIEIELVNNRDKAEEYRDVEMYVDEAELPKLKKSEYYIKDLIGSKATADEKEFGDVLNTFEIANSTLLLIKMKNGKELAVPLNKKYIKNINTSDKLIELINIDELL